MDSERRQDAGSEAGRREQAAPVVSPRPTPDGGAPDGIVPDSAAPAARPSQRSYRDLGARWLGTAAGAVIVIAGLRAASTIIVPVLVALFVSILSYPLVHKLRQRGVPLALAVAVTLLADLTVLAGAVALVSGSISDLIGQRAAYELQIRQYGDSLEAGRLRAVSWFEIRDLSPPGWLIREGDGETGADGEPNAVSGSTGSNARPSPSTRGDRGSPDRVAEPAAPSWWSDFLSLDALFNAANRAVRGLASVLSTILIVVLITCFILLEAASFPSKLARAFDRPGLEERIGKVTRELQRYLGLKTAIGLVTGLLVGIWVALCGLNSPILWGFVAFALNYIPNLGSIIAAVPAVMLALVQLGIGPAILVAVGYLAINIVVGNLLEPQILGRRLGLSALVVFLSLVFWGWVWGPVGMLLSVPITMVVKIALENTKDLRWVAVLLERGATR